MMCLYLIGRQFKGPIYASLQELPIKKGDCVRASLDPFIQFSTMTTSKDSQFLEVCKEPILTVSFTAQGQPYHN